MRQYPLVKALPYCCVCAVLESILRKRGCSISQTEIADAIGVTVHEEDAKEMSLLLKNITTSKENKTLGVHLYENTLNNFFQERHLPLKELFISNRELSEMNFESILTSVSDAHDVVILLDYGNLIGDSSLKDTGHAVLFLQQEGGYTEILNPGPDSAGTMRVLTSDLLFAIKSNPSGGISIIG